MKHNIKFFLAAAALLVILNACTPIPLTMQERIYKFITDLNRGQYGARADTYLNFSPDIALYDAIQGYYPATTDYYWDYYFPQTDPACVYSISSVIEVDAVTTTAVFSVDPDGGGWGFRDAKFVMVQDGLGNNLISELWLDHSGTLTQIIW